MSSRRYARVAGCATLAAALVGGAHASPIGLATSHRGAAAQECLWVPAPEVGKLESSVQRVIAQAGPAGLAPMPSDDDAETAYLAEIERLIVEGLNRFRAENGLPPVTENAAIKQLARAQCEYVASKSTEDPGYFDSPLRPGWVHLGPARVVDGQEQPGYGLRERAFRSGAGLCNYRYGEEVGQPGNTWSFSKDGPARRYPCTAYENALRPSVARDDAGRLRPEWAAGRDGGPAAEQAASAIEAWKSSASHRKNMLSLLVNESGTAVCRAQGGAFAGRLFHVQGLMLRTTASPGETYRKTVPNK